MTTENQKLGRRIRAARTKAKLTQRKLAHLCGLKGDGAGAYLGRIEAGAQEPRTSMQRKIAKHCGVTLADIVGA